MISKIQRVVFWGFFLGFIIVISAHAQMRIQKKVDATARQASSLLPDLVVQDIRISPAPKDGEAIGKPAQIRIVIKNAADGPAQASAVRIQCKIQNSKAKKLPGELSGVLPLQPLSKGNSATLLWPKPSSSAWVAGDYMLSVEVDYQKKITESNEKNNTKTYQFRVSKTATPPAAQRHSPTSVPGLPKPKKPAANQSVRKTPQTLPGIPQRSTTVGSKPKFTAKPSSHVGLNRVSVSDSRNNLKLSDEALCGNYAREAAAQFNQAEQNMCGFHGGGWHHDVQKHFDWCMSASQDQRRQESENRKKALRSCGEITRLDNPEYLGLAVDFCMYRRTERHSTTPIEGGSYDYDFGWMCDVPEVAESYCISQGYKEMVEYKVADQKSAVDTMPVGNIHPCDASIQLSNCRGFDYITCRKPVTSASAAQIQPMPKGMKSVSQQQAAVIKTTETICQEYAHTAVRQYHQAINSYCNLSVLLDPQGWHGDLKKHYDWCMAATTAQRESETDKRQDQLTKCAETERTRFEKPMFNNKRVDTFVDFRKKRRGEPDVPQRAADLFCQEMGYEKAIREWFLYNTTYAPESLDNTIHMGEGHPECNTDWPSFNDKCEGFNHITCERPAQH